MDQVGTPANDLGSLASLVKESSQKADRYCAQLRRTNSRLLIFSILTSGASTLVTGVTAAGGPVIGEGVPGWRLACIVGALFGFATTVSTSLNAQLKYSERLSEGNQCAARLRLLNTALATGRRTWEEAVKEYDDILRAYPEPLR